MPAMKIYSRVNFQAYPDKTTPVSATNLNKMDKGIDDIDNEVVAINDKLNKHTISYARRETLQFETDYTTLEDGYFLVSCPGNANGDINWVAGRINGVSVAYVSNTGNPRMSISAQANIAGGTSIFVRKGSVISYTSSGSNIGICYFYPLA